MCSTEVGGPTVGEVSRVVAPPPITLPPVHHPERDRESRPTLHFSCSEPSPACPPPCCVESTTDSPPITTPAGDHLLCCCADPSLPASRTFVADAPRSSPVLSYPPPSRLRPASLPGKAGGPPTYGMHTYRNDGLTIDIIIGTANHVGQQLFFLSTVSLYYVIRDRAPQPAPIGRHCITECV